MTAAAKHKHQDGGPEWLQQHQEATEKGERGSLPAFEKPEHVQRDVFGAYLVDPTANVVHRVAGASRDCKLDQIDPAWFVHWWPEVQEHHGDAEVCKSCDWKTS